MSTVTLTTVPLTCPSCIATIEKGLARRPGVDAVKVRFASNAVRVDYDQGRVTRDDLVNDLDALGYPVRK